jgi:hypothetical protein
LSRTTSAAREETGREGVARDGDSAAAWPMMAAAKKMALDAAKRGAAESMAATT